MGMARLRFPYPAQEAELKKNNIRYDDVYPIIRFMASSMTRRRNATTRPRPGRHGHAPLTGSTSTCATDWDNPIGSGWFPKPYRIR
jgi:hypothetical protein